MAILAMAVLAMAVLAMAILTMAILTMAILTLAILTMAILTMADPGFPLLLLLRLRTSVPRRRPVGPVRARATRS